EDRQLSTKQADSLGSAVEREREFGLARDVGENMQTVTVTRDRGKVTRACSDVKATAPVTSCSPRIGECIGCRIDDEQTCRAVDEHPASLGNVEQQVAQTDNRGKAQGPGDDRRVTGDTSTRSEERRVGKECRSR